MTIDRRSLLAGLAAGLLPVRAIAQEADTEAYFNGTADDNGYVYRRTNMSLIEPRYRRQLVKYIHTEPPGSVVVDTRNHALYLTFENNTALRYGVGVGREGFQWFGRAEIGRKAAWPGWTPPPEMLKRRPDLPRFMAGGPDNPLGPRAHYLYRDGRDLVYRIHGTTEPWSIGTDVSSGCIRMLNEDVIDLYQRVPVGTRVLVLPHLSPDRRAV
ncbi:MAG TPA: L,D-transpeptidase [Microvirga sp.]|jgi:lipoprotein-anchoring transpeptidase ErfK/SrfK|nr:L,D-transpeptidase [Microvirga sp.]